MRLDRASTPDGKQKYALVHWRRFKAYMLNDQNDPILREEASRALEALINKKVVEHGNDFFVLKYKDQFAKPAFMAYVQAVDSYLRWLEHRADAPGDADQMPPEEITRQIAELRPYLSDLQIELGRMGSIPNGLPNQSKP